MGELGDDWREIKRQRREKKNARVDRIGSRYQELIAHPLTKKVGEQHRIESWDFWYSGTAYNYKTGAHSSVEELHKKYCSNGNET